MKLSGSFTCPVCDSSDTQPVGELRDGCHVMQCSQCRLEFVRPIWGQASALVVTSTVTDSGYIEAMKAEYQSVKHQVESRAKARLAYYKNLLDGRSLTRILEVGSGTGWMARALSDLGVTCVGLEIRSDLVRIAQTVGADVRQGDICDSEIGTMSTYDVVFSSQTLEHITTPRQALANIYKLLRPGGVVHIDVPNANSWGARLRRIRHNEMVWGAISLPHHQTGYFPESLRRLFEDTGLQPLAIFERPTDDRLFGQTIVPAAFLPDLAIRLSRLFGHGYLLVGLACKPLSA